MSFLIKETMHDFIGILTELAVLFARICFKILILILSRTHLRHQFNGRLNLKTQLVQVVLYTSIYDCQLHISHLYLKILETIFEFSEKTPKSAAEIIIKLLN